MIEGLVVRKLERHADERGSLVELLRADWPEFGEGFGQAIVTVNEPGVIRGWHFHRRQTDRIVVIAGEAVVPVYDAREGSSTKGKLVEHHVTGRELVLIVVPPGVYHGYKTTGTEAATILNFPDRVYDPTDPDEARAPFDDRSIGYSW